MKLIRTIVVFLAVLTIPVFTQVLGLERITYKFVPREWKLFRMAPEIASTVYKTEFCVADTSKIEVNVFKLNSKTGQQLVRNLVDKNSFIFEPAVYYLGWYSAPDSLDLPVVSGEHKIVVKAFSASSDKLIFSDSISRILVFEWWKDIGVHIEENDWHVYDSTGIYQTGQLEKRVHGTATSPKVVIPSIRFGVEKDKLAIRFVLSEPRETDLDRRFLTELYRCKKDSTQDYGIKIYGKVEREYQKDFSKVFHYSEDEMLLIHYLGYDPISLNLNDIFLRYKELSDKIDKKP